tara:strand:+ start:2642 stop:3391 length:750 start_codon:yes stop_codon:yes gene_type:complete
MIIAGYGFVGKAYELLFKDWRDIIIHDPPKNKYADFTNANAVIVCVSTPEADDNSCDMSAVIDVVQQCAETTPIMIKSTISLQGWKELKDKFPNHKLCFSPEFLRAANYMNDVKNISSVILSGDIDYWRDQYAVQWPKVKQYIVPPEEAIVIKYFRNAFLATKLSFFNEMYDFCEKYNISFDDARAGVASDHRIGESHTLVYPDEGFRGWGGMCFPKDTKALTKMAKEKNINLNTLQAAMDYNSTLKRY